jgi:hypothetical protein
MSSKDWTAAIILAIGVAAVAFVYSISFWLVPALASAVGVGAAAYTKAIVTPKIVNIGLGVAGGSTVIMASFVTVKVVGEVKKQPFLWATSVFGLLSPFVAEFSKEFYPNNEDKFLKVIMKTIVGTVFVLASILWSEQDKDEATKNLIRLRKGMSILVYSTIPILIIVRALYGQQVGLSGVATSTWLALGALLSMFGIVLGVKRLFG